MGISPHLLPPNSFLMQYTIRYLREPFLDVGFIAHPTNTTAAEVSALRGPLSIAAAENDQFFPIEKRFESEELLRKNPAKPTWQINVYPGVGHGFAARGNRKIRAESWAMDQAFGQAVSWMDEHLSAEF
jgi:dienelactone hydrolase